MFGEVSGVTGFGINRGKQGSGKQKTPGLTQRFVEARGGWALRALGNYYEAVDKEDLRSHAAHSDATSAGLQVER